MKTRPVANSQSSQKGILTLTTLGLALMLSACGQKGQLYPAPAEKPAPTETAGDNDMMPAKPSRF